MDKDMLDSAESRSTSSSDSVVTNMASLSRVEGEDEIDDSVTHLNDQEKQLDRSAGLGEESAASATTLSAPLIYDQEDRCITPQNYDAAEIWCHQMASSNHDMLYHPNIFERTLQEKAFELQFPVVALQSLFRNAAVNHMKKTAPIVKRQLSDYYVNEYCRGRSILDLAQQKQNINSSNGVVYFSPYMLARYLTEEMTSFQYPANQNTNHTHNNHKKMLAEAMRDPEGILGNRMVLAEAFRDTEPTPQHEEGESLPETTTRLAREVREAITRDPLFGPMHDKERHIVGIEYEVVLEHELRTLGTILSVPYGLFELPFLLVFPFTYLNDSRHFLFIRYSF